MTIVLYTFSKRPDSTKRPSSGGRSLSATLKEATSILYPSFLFQFSGNPTAYNYAYVPDFDRYYYITDWTATAGMWDATCKVDVLASWKENIGASKQYVLRAEAESDGTIIDTLYPTKGAAEVVTDDMLPVWEEGQTFVVGVYGDNGATIGGISYITLTPSEMKNYMAAILGIGSWTDNVPAELGEEVFKTIFNPIQYIASVMLFPFTIPGRHTVRTLKFGWWDFEISCGIITERTYTATTGLGTLPKHPQANERGAYLNASPYTKYSFWAPPFGEVELDTPVLLDCDWARVDMTIDYVTGKCTGVFMGQDGKNTKYLFTRTSTLAVPVQLSQITAGAGVGQVVSSAVALGRDAIMGNALGAAENVGEMASAALPKITTVGTNGDFSQYSLTQHITATFLTVVDEDIDGRGRPLCKTRRISDLPGFVQVSDAKIAFNCTSPETTEIKNFMEGGFHYE